MERREASFAEGQKEHRQRRCQYEHNGRQDQHHHDQVADALSQTHRETSQLAPPMTEVTTARTTTDAAAATPQSSILA